ncbi:hypothetical protein BVX93_00095, partial [bacterium B13(2017)]
KRQTVRRMDSNEGISGDDLNSKDNYNFVFVDCVEYRYEDQDFFGNIGLTDERHYTTGDNLDGLDVNGNVFLPELVWTWGSINHKTGFDIRGKYESMWSSNYYVNDISQEEAQKDIESILDGPEINKIEFDSFEVELNSNKDCDGNYTEKTSMTFDVHNMSSLNLKDITLNDLISGTFGISKDQVDNDSTTSGLLMSALQKHTFSSIDNNGNIGKTLIQNYDILNNQDGFIGGQIAWDTEVDETDGRITIAWDFTRNGQSRYYRTMQYIKDENGHVLFQDAMIGYRVYNFDGHEIYSRTAFAVMEIDPLALTSEDENDPDYYAPWGDFENFKFIVNGYQEVRSKGLDSKGNAHYKETINSEIMEGKDGVLGVSEGEVFKTETYTVNGEERQVHYIAAAINDLGVITSYYRIEYQEVAGVGLHVLKKEKYAIEFDDAGNILGAQSVALFSESDEFIKIYNAKIFGNNYSDSEAFGIMVGAING